MNLERLNEMLVGRLKDVWGQQDQDWERKRRWDRQDRGRSMLREDAAFGHAKQMWGLEAERGRQQVDAGARNAGFRQWYQNRFQSLWDSRMQSRGGLQGSGQSQQPLFSNDRNQGRRSLFGGGGYGY